MERGGILGITLLCSTISINEINGIAYSNTFCSTVVKSGSRGPDMRVIRDIFPTHWFSTLKIGCPKKQSTIEGFVLIKLEFLSYFGQRGGASFAKSKMRLQGNKVKLAEKLDYPSFGQQFYPQCPPTTSKIAIKQDRVESWMPIPSLVSTMKVERSTIFLRIHLLKKLMHNFRIF